MSDENMAFASVCYMFSKYNIALHNACKTGKLKPQERAYIENLIFDLTVILKEDDILPDTNVVDCRNLFRGVMK